jgi:hypothetical protein
MLSVPSVAHADVAPPSHPPGANPGPETEGTQVRMLAETVTIDVLAGAPANSLGKAKVTADFTMRNLGSSAEKMGVRFPISSDNGFGEFPEIKDLQIFMDNRSVATRRISEVDPVWGGEPVPWSEFDVNFPPNVDVNIRVTYTLEGTGEYPYVAFAYIFHTGAGWQGTIGSADLIVRLPYEANTYNVIFDDEIGWSTTTSGGVINGREVRWHFEDFEPEQSNDFHLSLVMPAAWKKVLDEQANLQKNPNDGEAWGRLGKVYKEIQLYRRGYRLDAGGAELYQLAIAAYEKAVTLKPDDALWHAGFADLLAVHAYYESFNSTEATPDKLRAMQEINRALQLAPNDPKVKEIAEKVYFLFMDGVELTDNGYIFHWLTATPIPATPTLTLTEATSTPPATTPPLATETTVPEKEASPTSTPPPAVKNPLCGSVLFIPLAVIVFAGRKRRHSGL